MRRPISVPLGQKRPRQVQTREPVLHGPIQRDLQRTNEFHFVFDRAEQLGMKHVVDDGVLQRTKDEALRPGRASLGVAARIAQLTGLNDRDLLIDIGSGDGVLVVALHKLTGCFALGVECVPDRFLASLTLAADCERADAIAEQELAAGTVCTEPPPTPRLCAKSRGSAVSLSADPIPWVHPMSLSLPMYPDSAVDPRAYDVVSHAQPAHDEFVRWIWPLLLQNAVIPAAGWGIPHMRLAFKATAETKLAAAPGGDIHAGTPAAWAVVRLLAQTWHSRADSQHFPAVTQVSPGRQLHFMPVNGASFASVGTLQRVRELEQLESQGVADRDELAAVAKDSSSVILAMNAFAFHGHRAMHFPGQLAIKFGPHSEQVTAQEWNSPAMLDQRALDGLAQLAAVHAGACAHARPGLCATCWERAGRPAVPAVSEPTRWPIRRFLNQPHAYSVPGASPSPPPAASPALMTAGLSPAQDTSSSPEPTDAADRAAAEATATQTQRLGLPVACNNSLHTVLAFDEWLLRRGLEDPSGNRIISRVRFTCGSGFDDHMGRGLHPWALRSARVVVCNNYNGFWSNTGRTQASWLTAQLLLLLKCTLHMARGSILVLLSPLLEEPMKQLDVPLPPAAVHGRTGCVHGLTSVTRQGHHGYQTAKLYFYVHGGAPTARSGASVTWEVVARAHRVLCTLYENNGFAALDAAQQRLVRELAESAVALAQGVWESGTRLPSFTVLAQRISADNAIREDTRESVTNYVASIPSEWCRHEQQLAKPGLAKRARPTLDSKRLKQLPLGVLQHLQPTALQLSERGAAHMLEINTDKDQHYHMCMPSLAWGRQLHANGTHPPQEPGWLGKARLPLWAAHADAVAPDVPIQSGKLAQSAWENVLAK